jgi:hypothetical protein
LGHLASSITLNLPILRDLVTPKEKKKKDPIKTQSHPDFQRCNASKMIYMTDELSW